MQNILIFVRMSSINDSGTYHFIGSPNILHSFFSNIAYHLEDKAWGSRFPKIMGELYNGKLEVDSLDEALQEVKQIEQELAQIPADKVIWDFDDLRKPFPKDKKFNPEADNLADFLLREDPLHARRIIDIFSESINSALFVTQKYPNIKYPIEIVLDDRDIY